MSELIVFILFVLGGNGGFSSSDIPEAYQFNDKSGATASSSEISAKCTGKCYDFWKAYAVDNEKQALEGGISTFIGAN